MVAFSCWFSIWWTGPGQAVIAAMSVLHVWSVTKGATGPRGLQFALLEGKTFKAWPKQELKQTEWPGMASKKSATTSSSSFPFSARSVSISVWTSQVLRISVGDLHIRSHAGDSLHYMDSSGIVLNTAGNWDLLRVPSCKAHPRAFILLLVNVGKLGKEKLKISISIWITDVWDFGTLC